jgi:hypothetical protein
MTRQRTYATRWQPIVVHEPGSDRADDGGHPLRAILIAIPIAAVLWAAFGGGIWFVLRLPVS